MSATSSPASPAETDYFLGGEGRLNPQHAAVALVVVDRSRYLMQLRDQKPGIYYPGHWGVFGGAVDPGETVDEALARELAEELALPVTEARYFTEIAIDFTYYGASRINRRYYEVHIAANAVDELVLGEGQALGVFDARELLAMPRVVPYDAMAIWMHATRPAFGGGQGGPAGLRMRAGGAAQPACR